MEDTDAQGQPFWPELEEMARPARERRRLSPDTRSAIILRLCARAPLSVKEISILLERSEAYVGDAIRPLVTAGNLTFLYPSQPRHPRQKYITAAEAAKPADVKTEPQVKPEPEDEPKHGSGPVPEAQPVTPAPAPAVNSLPTPAPAVKSVPEPEPVTEAAPPFPNQWTNVAYVIIVGLVLALTGQRNWALLATIAAAGLSWLHVAVGSTQFRRFAVLQSARNRSVAFMLLKSAVTFAEIAIVYLAAAAFTGTT